jgi:thermitase
MNNFKIEKFVLKVMGCCVALSLMAAVGLAGDEVAYVPGKVLIKFESGIMPMGLTTGIPEVDAVFQSFNIKSVSRALTYRPLHSDAYDRWWLLDFPEDAPVGEIIEILQPISGVEHAGLSHILFPASEPTDPCFVDQLQWNLHNTGQRGGIEDADIDAPEGWAYFGAALPGSPAVIVAVIDSGIKKSHPEFNNPDRLVISMNENDQNFTQDPSLEDICSNYHGTRISGFIAANWNNTKQLAGIDAQCRIMPLKIFEGINCTGDSTWQRASDAIHYAADNGAKIISMSVQSFTGICDTGSLLYSAIDYARDPANGGCIIVAAAGNCGAGHADTSMPGCFREVISVGATDNRDQRAIWQNRTDCISAKSGFNDSATGGALDVMAPAGCGKDDTGTVCGAAGTAGVWASSVHNDPNPGITTCEGFSGTSSAAPQVAGVTSLMLALDPSLTHDEAACLLAAGADDLGAAGRDNDFGWGRISMGQTFNCMAISPTGAPRPVALVSPGPGA